jgi:hypothetical protein
MNIEDLTLREIREIAAITCPQNRSPQPHPYKIGGLYFIRTVTMSHAGRLVEVGDHELILEDASWIADTGRLTQALATGQFSEVEKFPVGRVIVGRGALVDACEITVIPVSQK